MAIEIIWSEEAKDTFDENIHYLQKEWTDKEINKFILQTQKVISVSNRSRKLILWAFKTRNIERRN